MRTPLPGDPEPPQDLAVFVSASYANRTVRTLWARSPKRRRIVWATDHPSVMPVGSAYETFDAAGLEALEWEHSRLRIHDVGEPVASGGLLLEDVAEAFDGGGVAWMVSAEPTPGLSTPEWQSLSQDAGRGARGSVEEQVSSERARRILGYIERVSPRGLWHLVLHCGAETRDAAISLRGHLLSTSDVLGLPTLLSTDPDDFAFVDSAVVAALGRAPVAERAGYRITERSAWDLTPEERGPIQLGSVLDSGDHQVGRMGLSTEAINRHLFITGATGSGKSETVRRILQNLTSAGIPWLVIEPAKAEYHRLAALVHPAEVDVLRPGDPSSVPVMLNPLEPTSIVSADGRQRTFPLPTHISLVRSLFEAAFEGQEPFPQILAAALDRSYQNFGWNIALSRPEHGSVGGLRYPNLSDLRNNALAIVDELGYGTEVRDNVRGFVDVRINSLRQGAAGRFFESGHPIDLQKTMHRNVVLQIEDLGNEQDQAFLMGTVLMRWSQLLRLLGDTQGVLRHVIVLEEAHRLLRATEDEPSSAIEQFANVLAEVRSYGQGVIVAEQIPSKIVTDVIKNSGTKIVHRLPSLDDRQSVGATMNLDEEQSSSVLSLRPGIAAVHSAGMDRPVRVSITPPPAQKADRETFVVPHGRRSGTCSFECRESACAMSTLEVARSLVRVDSFRSWVDLVVLAFLVGEEPPVPPRAHTPRWRRAASGRRAVRCAVGIAVDESVAIRMSHLVGYFSPDDFGFAVSEEAFGAILTNEFARNDYFRWQVAEFRWRDVAKALLAADPGSDVPASLSADWASRGLKLERSTAGEQLVELQEIHRGLRTSYWTKILGQPSILEDVARRRKFGSPSEVYRWLELSSPWVPGLLSDNSSKGTG